MRVAADAGEPVTRSELEAALAALETHLTWRPIGLMVAVNALLLAAFKLIP
ncbi:MAG: hypothetical protein OXE76_10620 [Alphaproteobacteria bacterium]|nr:hypothetical protein [Alphaproteobacteria bacterium]